MASRPTSTIANGTSSGTVIKSDRDRPVGVLMPSSWTAATLGFDVTFDGGTTWVALCNLVDTSDGDEATYTVVAAKYYALSPSLFAGVIAFRPRSGTASSPVNQGAARVLTFSMLSFE